MWIGASWAYKSYLIFFGIANSDAIELTLPMGIRKQIIDIVSYLTCYFCWPRLMSPKRNISVLLISYWSIIASLLIDNIPSFKMDWNLLAVTTSSAFWGHNLCPIDCCLHLRPSCPTNSWFNKAIVLGYLEHIPLEPSPSNRLAIQSAFQALRIYWPLFGGKSKTHLQVGVLCQSWSLPVPTQEGSEARNSPWFGVCSHFPSSNECQSIIFICQFL